MSDLIECTTCGQVFPKCRVDRRQTLPAVRHMAAGDCEPPEEVPSCPECGRTDLDEPILSAASLEARLAVMYPYRCIAVLAAAYRFIHGSRPRRSLQVHVVVDAPLADPDAQPITARGLTLRGAMQQIRQAEARRQRAIGAAEAPGGSPDKNTPRRLRRPKR